MVSDGAGRELHVLSILARLNSDGVTPTLANLAATATLSDREADSTLEMLLARGMVQARTVERSDNPLTSGPQIRYQVTEGGLRELHARQASRGFSFRD